MGYSYFFYRNVSKGSIDKVDNNDNQKDDWDDMNRPAKMIKVSIELHSL